MTTRSTSISCTVPIPSYEHEILSVISQLVDESIAFENQSDISMTKSMKNKFTTKETTLKAVSVIGCVRLLVKGTEYWGDEMSCSTVESWVASGESTILPILKFAQNSEGGGDDSAKLSEVYKQSLVQFLEKVDSYLKDKKQTYLVGDYPTAADVVLCLLLAQASVSMQVSDWPQECLRWGKQILTQLEQITPKDSVVPWGKYKSQLQGAAGGSSETKETSAPAPVTSADGEGNAVIDKLKELQIEHSAYEHKLAKTAEELIEGVPLPSEKDTHTKNLFLRDKKHGIFLVTVAANPQRTTPVQTKELGKLIGLTGKTNLRLADEKTLMDFLHCKPGCVGPLAMCMKKPEQEVTLVLDKSLVEGDLYTKIHSHPLRNDMSVSMTPADLLNFCKKIDVEPKIIEFGDAPAGGGGKPPAEGKQQQKKQQPKKEKKEQQQSNKKSAKKGDTLLALQWKKEENFPMWYSDVIVLSEMIAYYDISGCYILRPWSFKMWELIKEWFNSEIEALGVENAYFPMFVSQDRLEKEKDHVEGFAPEVAWVTKSGDGELAKPIAVRPTSETIMYPAYSDWIKSHRDLPLKLNQWSNVVRWEFKYPTPFLRTREFLWQEGHTAHDSYDDAQKMVRQILELYRQVYEDLLAVPVIPGYKTDKERFAGGHITTTVEAYIPMSGRAIQGATSHNLGQNFGKMFDITYQDKDGKSQIVWQTSWGLTTRSIGVMVMVHGDDTGLVLPPRVAPLQVVIVPIVSKKLTTEDAQPYCEAILEDLKAKGIRAKYDDRTMYNPGWKYNHWEQKGVPIRIEVGPRDIEQKQARVVIRHNGEKIDLPVDGLGDDLVKRLDTIQSAMFEKVKEKRDQHVAKITEWKDFVPNLELNNLVLTPWCGGEHQDWEEWVKTKSREESLKEGEEEDDRTATSVAAKTLCIPFDQPELPAGTKCIASGLDATCWVLWGRSY